MLKKEDLRWIARALDVSCGANDTISRLVEKLTEGVVSQREPQESEMEDAQEDAMDWSEISIPDSFEEEDLVAILGKLTIDRLKDIVAMCKDKDPEAFSGARRAPNKTDLLASLTPCRPHGGSEAGHLLQWMAKVS